MKGVLVGSFAIACNNLVGIHAILKVFVLDIRGIRGLRKEDTALDLCAWIDEFAVLCSKVVGKSGFVISVEHNLEHFEILRNNVTLNEYGKVIVLSNAFSGTMCEIELQFNIHSFKAKMITAKDVQVCLGGGGREKLYATKIDIEGYEVETLAQLGDFLTEVGRIMIELHVTKEKIDEELGAIGMRFIRLKRHQYLISSLRFLVLHPTSFLNLYKTFITSSENPKLNKIISGIDITSSEDLIFGG